MGDTRSWWIQQWMAVKDLPPMPDQITLYDLAIHAVVKMEYEASQVRRAINESKAQERKPSPRPRQ